MTTSDRASARNAFVEAAGWAGARIEPLAGDASTRSYFRVRDSDRRAMLMDAPPGAEAPACPPDAGPEERAELGYNAVARLAGPNLVAFAGLARALKARGFSTPDIHASDIDQGFLLMEDLGDDLYARIIPSDWHEGTLYSHAVDLLAALYRCSMPAEVGVDGRTWPLQDYDAVAMRAETDLFLDWFMDQYSGVTLDQQARDDWNAIWDKAFARLEACPKGIVLRDFHAENLIYLPEREGEACVGLLDFQDAVMGHPAYDLVSLLEDARRNVDRKLSVPLKARFVAKAGIEDSAGFDASYAVLGAQRNAKILGIFVRLAKRDGKEKYLEMLPHVARLFVGDLQHPALMDLLMWTKTHADAVFKEAHK